MLENLDYLTLAYVGDAVLELLVRRRLVKTYRTAPECHQNALRFVTAKNQARAIRAGMEYLTEEEKELFTRAKNAKAHSAPRHTDLYTYRVATGLEALLGYHYLHGNEKRCEELLLLLYPDLTKENEV